MDEIYNLYNLDSGYTKNYGTFDISNIENEPNLISYKKYLEGVNKYLKKFIHNSYIIHLVVTNNNDDNIEQQSTQDINIINNYGDYINFNSNECNNSTDNGDTIYNFIVNTGRTFNSSYSNDKCILPDILINMIKSKQNYHNINMSIFSKEIALLSEDYYKKFIIMQYKNKKYISHIEKLTEENTKINLELQNQKEEMILKPTFPDDDILFQQIKDLKLQVKEFKKQINKLENEKEQIYTKYIKMHSEVKEFMRF
jgi:hypothetical protein